MNNFKEGEIYMRFKKTIFTTIGTIFIIGILITINVQASNSLKATVQSSKSEIEKAQEVEITLKLEDYQHIDNGINAYKATLEYDENTFEKVLEQNFVCKNNWELLKYNKDTKEFVAIKKVGSNQPEEVASITLKAKQEVEPKTTQVKVKEIVTSDGKKDINVEEAQVTIDVIKQQDVKPEEPEKITSAKYKIEQEYISKIPPRTTVGQFKQNVKIENVTTDPQMKFIDESGNTLQDDSVIKTGTKLKVGSSLQFTLIVTGDIDRDSDITINDLAKIKLHLIETKLLTGIELKSADLDGDNKITVNDLANMKLVLIGLLEIK